MFLAQACLIGVWMGMGRSGALRKCFVAGFGILLLGATVAFAQWSSFGGQANMLVFMPMCTVLMATLAVATAVFLIVARKWKNAALVSRWQSGQNQAEAFQFGVRHLLVVTFVVATLLGLRGAASQVLLDSGEVVRSILVLLFLGVALGIPSVAIVWATLGTKRPHERLVVAMALALLVATLLPIYMGEDWRGQDFWKSALTMLVMFAVIIISLLMTRSAGYRLVQDPE